SRSIWATVPVRAASEGDITPGDDILAAYDRRVDEVAVFVSFFLDDDLNAGARMFPVLPLPRPFAKPRHLVDCQLSHRHITAPPPRPPRIGGRGTARDSRINTKATGAGWCKRLGTACSAAPPACTRSMSSERSYGDRIAHLRLAW